MFMQFLPSYSSTADFCEAVSDMPTGAGDDWQTGLWFNLAPFILTKVQGYLFMLSRERDWPYQKLILPNNLSRVRYLS